MQQKLIPVAFLVVACGGDAFSTSDDEVVGAGAASDDGGLSSDGIANGGQGGNGGHVASGGAPDGGTDSADTGGTTSTGGAVSTGGSSSSSGGGGSSGASGGSPPSGGSSGSPSSGGSGGDPGECSSGAVQCVDAQRQTCVGGTWLDDGAPCTGWCVEGACTECKPETKSCGSDVQPRTCDATGAWLFDAACEGTSFCLEGSCANLCCRGNVSTRVACNADNPFTCGSSADCTDPSQCTIDLLCMVPGSFSGVVEICP